MENVEERVRKVLAEQLGVNERSVMPNQMLGQDLGADSLDRVEIVMALEEEFGVVLTDEQAEELDTVGKIIEHLASRKE